MIKVTRIYLFALQLKQRSVSREPHAGGNALNHNSDVRSRHELTPSSIGGEKGPLVGSGMEIEMSAEREQMRGSNGNAKNEEFEESETKLGSYKCD